MFDDTRKSLELYIRDIISSDKEGLKYENWNIQWNSGYNKWCL